MGQLTQTTAQVQVILDDADAANVGKTSLTDSTDTTAVAVKKSGFYSLGASSSNAPSTDRAILISAVRDTAATGEIRYGQVAITESNGMWWNRDDGGALGTWYEAVSTAGTQTLTNKTLTSPVLTTPQINDTSADHQYIFAVSELVADRTVTLPLLTGNDTFVFAAHTQTLTNKTLTSPVFNTGVSGTAVLDDDTFATASSTTLATSESIKAYVDTQLTAEDLDFAGDTGTGAVDLDSQTFTIAGTANEIETSATGQTLTIGLPNSVTITTALSVDTISEKTAAAGVTVDSLLIKDGGITAAGTSTFSGQTISDLGTVTTANIDGGSIDGTTIGASTAAAGTFTSVTADGLTVDTDTLVVDAANNRVGLGTASPARLLELSNTTASESYLRISGNSGNVADANFAGIEFYNTDGSGVGPNVASFIEARAETSTGAGSELVFATSSSSDLEGARATERMRIDASGNVGIGTTNPSSKLVVAGTGTGQGIEAKVDTEFDGDATTKHTKLTVSSSNTADSIAALEFQARNVSNVWRNGSLALDDGALTFLIPSAANTVPQTTDERMRIDSSGRLLINKTVSTGSLSLESQAPSGFSVGSGFYSTSAQSTIEFKDSNTTANYKVRIGSETDDMLMFAGGSERMRINSSGQVFVGTTDNSTSVGNLIVKSDSNAHAITIEEPAGAGETWQIGVDVDGDLGFYNSTSTTASVTLDDSGNLLVGTTDALPVTNNDANGIALRADGNAQFSRSGAATARFNRGTSDGEIVSFQKDGVQVGSIGSADLGDRIYFAGAAEGLAIDNSLNAILPCDASGGATNGALDIGYSSTKFRDLYLSGGVYVGGTGAANYLDDYEEGIHQTTATPGTSGTITLISTNDDISYVKIGNSVHIVGCIVVQSGSAAVGSYIEFSLPFQITDLAGSSGRFGNAATYLDSSASTFSLLPMQALEGVSLVRVYIDASTVAVNDQFYFSFLYRGA
jgi:hypothetical protein